ncbi:MAG TPA: hypothetical protein VLD19_06665, partial [Chitinophagaceae bacterium]|nr:hypothetical protein [Chitinophagaceae bacterium]
MTPITHSGAQTLQGEYQLKGGFEMVAAFYFDSDQHFKFYYAYGASDRQATGTYKIANGKVILHGTKVPGKDFTVVHQKHEGEGTTIKITDNNPALVQSVFCMFIKGEEKDIQYSDNTGIAHSPMAGCDTIFVMHSIFPDILTTVKYKDSSNKNNYFELTLNPSLAEVCFKDFEMVIDKDTLSGSMPYLFEKEKSFFVKQQP